MLEFVARVRESALNVDCRNTHAHRPRVTQRVPKIMQIEIDLEKLPTAHVVTLRGRLDSAGTPAFKSTMENLIDAGETNILLDCADLRYVSSIGLGVFVTAGKRLTAANGTLAFSSLNQHVRSVFEMVGFFKIFEVYSSREDALESARFRAAD